MNEILSFSGQLPEHFDAAFAEIGPELGFARAGQGGLSVALRQGGCLRAEKRADGVVVTWAEPVQVYRALSLLRQHWAEDAFCIEETPCFETAGMMFDVSRNAVLQPDTLRFFLRKMAMMGLNLGMMYTEDTYEVPGQPYFGYQRGRYSADELRALDDYADMLGVELCPCIQTLGHLNRALHWPALAHLKDNEEVLLADDAQTYAFLEELIAAAAAPYRSKRIHIGMDEAHGIGLGAHLRRHGYEDPHTIIRRHLSRVLEITRRHGLSAMMWSDMYFRPDSPTDGYYDSGMPSAEAVAAVPPDVTLVYWDYYHETEQEYTDMLQKHAALPAPTVFAGGIWTWCGPAPDYAKTLAAAVPALTACKKAGVPLVLATAWGDNGAEANLTSALLGMQLYAEFMYTGTYDAGSLRPPLCLLLRCRRTGVFGPFAVQRRARHALGRAAACQRGQIPAVSGPPGAALCRRHRRARHERALYGALRRAIPGMPMKTRPLNLFSVFTPFWPACWPANAPGTSRPRRPSSERILLWRHALPKPCPGPLRRRRRFAPHGARCGKPLTGPRASRSSTSAWAAWPQGFPPPQRACARLPRASARTSPSFPLPPCLIRCARTARCSAATRWGRSVSACKLDI